MNGDCCGRPCYDWCNVWLCFTLCPYPCACIKLADTINNPPPRREARYRLTTTTDIMEHVGQSKAST